MRHEEYMKKQAARAGRLPSFDKQDEMYMRIAYEIAQRSYDEEHKVGSVVTRGNQILSYGWNGTPHNTRNETRDHLGETKWEVIHAEANAVCKLAASTSTSEGATLYTTLSCCRECAKLILQSGIKRVVYAEKYKDNAPLEFLIQNNIIVDHLKYDKQTRTFNY